MSYNEKDGITNYETEAPRRLSAAESVNLNKNLDAK